MADLPLDGAKKTKKTAVQLIKDTKIQVTPENAAVLTVHFLSQIYGRLGYIVKLLEEKE